MSNDINLAIRRVINGRVYDTQTAHYVMTISNDTMFSNDYSEEYTELFRTDKGQFFIAGEGYGQWRAAKGKPTKRYGHPYGEGLKLISPEEAQALMEKHDGPVEAFFAVEEG